MEYKLIAIDMDGTLLNSNNKVSLRTKKTIELAKEKGVHVVLSTGRILRSALYFAEELQLNNPIIACNGAIILDEKRNVIYNRPIRLDAARKVMEIGKKYSVYYHFYNEESLFSRQYIKEIVDYYSTRIQKINVEVFEDDYERILSKNPNIFKFLFIDNDNEKLIRLREDFNSVEGISISKSWENNLEVMDLKASKGIGLKILCNELNIDQSQVIAIGDSENDLSMLQVAGLSVAMGNGDENVKLVADYVTDTCDNDGVAKAIEKFVL